MSLLDRRAPHVVNVQQRALTRDPRGLQVLTDIGPRVPVRCMVEPVRDWSSAEEDKNHGLQVVNMLVIRSREWPGDVYSHVYWDGSVFETIGIPQHFGVSKRTMHWRVTIQWVKKV